MQRADVLTALTARAVEVFAVEADAVTENASFAEDFQVDSLSLVEFTIDLEEEFGIDLLDDDLGALLTVGSWVDLIHRKVLAKA